MILKRFFTSFLLVLLVSLFSTTLNAADTTRIIEPYIVYKDGEYHHTVTTFYLNGANNENILIRSNANGTPTVYVNGSATIAGNLQLTSGTLDINGGALTVGENFLITQTGFIDMRDVSDSIVVNGNFEISSSVNQYDHLTNGVLEVKGDFTQTGADTTNFYTTGVHKVLLSGTDQQTVSFERTDGYARFMVLELSNESTEGIIFASSITVLDNLITNSTKVTDFVLHGNLSVENDNIIYGNLTITNYLNLNGTTMTVNGDLAHSNGTLDINNGEIIINGDFLINQTGFIDMRDVNDSIVVNGNFEISSSVNQYDHLTNGVLEVKGDFTQTGADTTNFYTTGVHKVLLSGTDQQTVSFERTDGYARFMVLELNNTTGGVVFTSPITVLNNLITNNTPVTNFVLQGNFSAQNNNTIHGDLTITNHVYLNGTTLTITGNLTHSSGTLNIGEGELIVNGDFLINQTGLIDMRDVSDSIVVNGNFEISSSANQYGYLTNGVLEVKGDFTQTGADTTNFYTTGVHKVLLSGTDQQTVSFERTDGYARFITLTLTNNSVGGTIFSTAAHVLGNLTATLCQTPLDLSNVAVDGTTTLSSSCDATTDTDGDGIPDHEDPNPNDGPLADNDNDGIVNQDDLDDDNDGMPDDYEIANGFDSLDPSDADEDADGDGVTNLEEYQAGTDPHVNPLALAIVGKTKYFANTTGTIGVRTYDVDGINYTGSETLANGLPLAVSGVYDIASNILTLERENPTSSTLVFTFISEDLGVMLFNLVVDEGTPSQSYFYDTEEERDASLGRTMNPAIIMYLLN